MKMEGQTLCVAFCIMPDLHTFCTMELMQKQIRYNAGFSIKRSFCVMPHFQIRYNDATPELSGIHAYTNAWRRPGTFFRGLVAFLPIFFYWQSFLSSLAVHFLREKKSRKKETSSHFCTHYSYPRLG